MSICCHGNGKEGKGICLDTGRRGSSAAAGVGACFAFPVNFHKRGNTIIVLLCGGDKRTQAKDITVAKRLAAEWSE
jgi:hypothetical protein